MDPFSAIADPWYRYLADAEDSISVIAPLLTVSKDMAVSIREHLRGKVTMVVTRDIPVSWFKRNGCLLGDVRSFEETEYFSEETEDSEDTAEDAGPRIWHVLGHLTAMTRLCVGSLPRARHLSALEQLPTGLVELTVDDDEYTRGACDLRHLTRLTSLDFRFDCDKAWEFETTRFPTSLEKLKIEEFSGNVAGMLRELPNLRELSYLNGNSTSDAELAEIFSSMTALTAVTMHYISKCGGGNEYGSDGYGGFAALLSALGTRLVSLIGENGGWDVEQCTALAGATNLTYLSLHERHDDQIKDLDALQRALLQLPKLEHLHMHVESFESTHSHEQLAAFAAVVKAAVPKAGIFVTDNRDFWTSSSDPDSESDFESEYSEEGHDE